MRKGLVVSPPEGEGYGFILPEDLTERSRLPKGKDLFFHRRDGVFPEGIDPENVVIRNGQMVVYILSESRDGRPKARPWTTPGNEHLLIPFAEDLGGVNASG